MLAFRPEDTRLLFTLPAGQKMFTWAVGFLIVGTVLELLMFAGLNRWQHRASERSPGLRRCVFGLGELLLMVFFFLPVFFALTVGPPALHITQVMNVEQ
jgi:hypothetical protein